MIQFKELKGYSVRKMHISRVSNIDICKLGIKKHHFKFFIEIDITKARNIIKRYKSKYCNLSLTGWILKSISDSIEHFKQSHGIQFGNKIMTFDEIDAEVQIEKEINNEFIPIPIIIRNINKKNIVEISQEIRQAKDIRIENYSLILSIFFRLPSIMRFFIWNIILKNPKLIKKYFGTVSITSIGMFGNFKGWIDPISIHQLCVGIGSIEKKEIYVSGNRIIKSDVIKITLLFDHDVIDGGLASRFVSYLTEIMEKCKNLSF